MYKPDFVFCYENDLIYVGGNQIMRDVYGKAYDRYIVLEQKLETQRVVFNIFPSNIYRKLKNV